MSLLVQRSETLAQAIRRKAITKVIIALHMVSWQQREVVTVPLEDAIAKYRPVDFDGTLVKTARGLGICLGD